MKTTDPSLETVPSGELVDVSSGTFLALSRLPVTFLDRPAYDEVKRFDLDGFREAFRIDVPKTAEASSVAAALEMAEQAGIPDKAGRPARIAWRDARGRVIEAARTGRQRGD